MKLSRYINRVHVIVHDSGRVILSIYPDNASVRRALTPNELREHALHCLAAAEVAETEGG